MAVSRLAPLRVREVTAATGKNSICKDAFIFFFIHSFFFFNFILSFLFAPKTLRLKLVMEWRPTMESSIT